MLITKVEKIEHTTLIQTLSVVLNELSIFIDNTDHHWKSILAVGQLRLQKIFCTIVLYINVAIIIVNVKGYFIKVLYKCI